MLLLVLASSTASAFAPARKRFLPSGPLLVAYATQCPTAHAVVSAKDGVNVLIWFATNLVVDHTTGLPIVETGRNFTCIALVANELKAQGFPTTHMMSIGGWDAPHPNTTLDGKAWWRVWKQWNDNTVAQLGWPGFDGIDWDLEGNDANASQWNIFTPECLRLVASMSRAAHEDGYIVSLVPPQTYLDATNSKFDLSLRHADGHGWKPDFHYHSWNVFAALLTSELAGPEGVEVYDFISVQLYETWSPADFQTIGPPGMSQGAYLLQWARQMNAGWDIAFEKGAPEMKISNQQIVVPPSKLVVGLSRGSPAGSSAGKSVYFPPSALRDVWAKQGTSAASGSALGEMLRGVMWWNVENDGGAVNGSATPENCLFSACFGEFVKTRNGSERRKCEC